MNKLPLAFAICFFGFWFTSPAYSADVPSSVLNKYYIQLLHNDGTGTRLVMGSLVDEVPPAQLDEFYAKLIDRGAADPEGSDVVSTIIYNLTGSEPEAAWSPHLERAVLAQAKHKDATVRGVLVQTLSLHDKKKYRELCLSFLNDPDPNVQRRAVDAVETWPDSKRILSDYVQGRTLNPNDLMDPVSEAKEFLNR